MEQPIPLLANAATMTHSPTSITPSAPQLTTTIPTAVPVKPKDGMNTAQHHQQQQDAVAVVPLAHSNTEQSLASTKEKSTPEKVSV